MIYIKFRDQDFDFGFEEKTNDEIIELVAQLFRGEKVKGKHNSKLKLKNREEKVEFWNLMRNSNFFHCVIDNRFSKDEIELMIIRIQEGIDG